MTSSEASGPKVRRRVGALLAVLVTLGFLGSAIAKLAHVPNLSEKLIHAGIPQGAIVPIAILELSCLVLYLFPRTSILGIFLLTGYLGGAIVTHIIGRQNFLPPLTVGLLMFASEYLRVPELRELVPFRKSLIVPEGVSHRLISVAS
jgi:hypothetical protein